MKKLFNRLTSVISVFVLVMTLVMSSVTVAKADEASLNYDSNYNFVSMTYNGITYTDASSAVEALVSGGISRSQAEDVINGHNYNSSKKIVWGNTGSGLSGYTYMSRSDAQALLNKYKNNEVYYGTQYIYYEGTPLTDFDNRVSGTYHTYSSYKAATRQGLSTSQSADSTYSVTTLYSVCVQNWDSNMTESQCNSAIATINSIAAQYNYGSTYDKVRAIAEYFAVNISYDYSKTYGDIYTAVTRGTGVCAAYAECFQLCMEYMGIESYIFTDTTHALNIVNLDGTYYYVDPTNMNDTNGVRWQFFLFGTNMRTNYSTLPISDSSYDGYTGNYGLTNYEGSERVESSDIQDFSTNVVAEEVTEAPTEAPTEEETTTEAETTTAVTTTAATTKSETETANAEEASESGFSAVVPVIVVAVVCVAGVGIAIGAQNIKKTKKKSDKDDMGE